MLAVIPNAITILRLFLTVPISISIYQGNNFLALLLFVLAGLSDSLDGFLARKYGWTSKFGEFADPVADKFLILSALLALAFSNQIPIWVASIMLARDGIIIVGVILYFSLFENYNLLPNRWGKHYTGWTISLFIIILLRGVFFNIPLLLEQVALVGTLSFLTLSNAELISCPCVSVYGSAPISPHQSSRSRSEYAIVSGIQSSTCLVVPCGKKTCTFEKPLG